MRRGGRSDSRECRKSKPAGFHSHGTEGTRETREERRQDDAKTRAPGRRTLPFAEAGQRRKSRIVEATLLGKTAVGTSRL